MTFVGKDCSPQGVMRPMVGVALRGGDHRLRTLRIATKAVTPVTITILLLIEIYVITIVVEMGVSRVSIRAATLYGLGLIGN